MATSTIPATKAALFELLETRPGAMAGIQVEWARPSGDAMALESMWFDGTESDQNVEAVGNLRRDERFTMHLIVSIVQDGDDARGCEERMWAIVAEVEQLVRSTPKVIGPPLFDIQYAGVDQRPAQAEGQRASEAVVRIAGRARI